MLTVTAKDDLHSALRCFTQKNIDHIPVVGSDEPGRIIGMLSRNNVIAAYHDRVTELQKPPVEPERLRRQLATFLVIAVGNL